MRRFGLAGMLLLSSLLAAVLPASAAEQPSPFLVNFSWDDGKIDSGPDTFTVFRRARGNVQLSSEFRVSGDQSVEIRDVAGDGDFPELFGSFPQRRDGWLVIHFALLVVNPQEELNIALAGKRGFGLSEDGIVLWLFTKNGDLLQMTNKSPELLLRLKPFTWYAIDADYDVVRGRYDLRITEEGVEKPVVSRKSRTNANALPGTGVSLFSFISDLKDLSNVVYFVDDVVVASSREVVLPPFVAPGRRQFLADTAAALMVPGEDAEPEAVRLERQGDEAFRRRSLLPAQQLYEAALRTAKNPRALLLKLSDVSFLLGDLAAEKALRERVYGSLDPR